MTEDVKKEEGQLEEGQTQQPEGKKTEERQYTEQELQAIEQGWDPDYVANGGDPNKARSAREFLDRGELLGKIKSQSTEIREVKQMLQHLSEHNRKVFQAGYEKALSELKVRRAEAIRNDDKEAQIAIEEELDKVKDTLTAVKNAPPQQVKQNPENSPVYQQWLTKNAWYLNDPAMRYWANGAAMEYGREHPNPSEEEVYAYLTKEVRKEWAHKFRKVAAPSPDGESRKTPSGSAASGTDEFEKLMSELPEDEVRMARNLIKMKGKDGKPLMTKEKYVEDYRLQERRG